MTEMSLKVKTKTYKTAELYDEESDTTVRIERYLLGDDAGTTLTVIDGGKQVFCAPISLIDLAKAIAEIER